MLNSARSRYPQGVISVEITGDRPQIVYACPHLYPRTLAAGSQDYFSPISHSSCIQEVSGTSRLSLLLLIGSSVLQRFLLVLRGIARKSLRLSGEVFLPGHRQPASPSETVGDINPFSRYRFGLLPERTTKSGPTLAITKGEYATGKDEPKVWFESLAALSHVLSDRNRDLLKLIL